MKTDGRSLRIWNDGLLGKNTIVPLDRDITVEHWLGGGAIQQPSALLAEGRPVMNSAYALYLVRGGYTMQTQKLYESDWTPLRFEGQTLPATADNLTGAKISLWPDTASAETENEVEEKTFMPLRFIAQATWGGPKPSETYAGFEALARKAGHAPAGRTPTAPAPGRYVPADRGLEVAGPGGGRRSRSGRWQRRRLDADRDRRRVLHGPLIGERPVPGRHTRQEVPGCAAGGGAEPRSGPARRPRARSAGSWTPRRGR
ncbi:hypothetical protein NKH18_34140 [Streptomyces sp. M10(2022)]